MKGERKFCWHKSVCVWKATRELYIGITRWMNERERVCEFIITAVSTMFRCSFQLGPFSTCIQVSPRFVIPLNARSTVIIKAPRTEYCQYMRLHEEKMLWVFFILPLLSSCNPLRHLHFFSAIVLHDNFYNSYNFSTEPCDLKMHFAAKKTKNSIYAWVSENKNYVRNCG